MKKGVDEVWNSKEPLVSSLHEGLLIEIERVIGKQEAYEYILSRCMQDRFDVFSLDEIRDLAETVSSICCDMSTLSQAAVKWSFLQGHIMAEIARRIDKEDEL